jgi:hypothetical protein
MDPFNKIWYAIAVWYTNAGTLCNADYRSGSRE